MAGKVFWVLALAILVTIGAIFKGYDILIAALGLVLITLISLKLSVDKGVVRIKDVKSELGGRLSSMDAVVQDLTKAFKEQAGVKEFTLGALERAKGEMRTEVKDGLDKMAKKVIDMENNVSQMKRTFSAAFAALDDRLRVIEPQAGADVVSKELAPEMKVGGIEEGYLDIPPENPVAE